MTREQHRLLREPIRVTDDKWFYLSRQGKCSFHDGKENQHVHDIPLKSILIALTRTGLIETWDSKKEKFKP